MPPQNSPLARRKNNANKLAGAKKAPGIGKISLVAPLNILPSRDKVQSTLEHEFCPPLDGALVAVLLSECTDLSEQSVAQLRATLAKLASGADDPSIYGDQASRTDESSASGSRSGEHRDFDSFSYSESISTSTPLDAQSSASSNVSISSPVGFLRTLFPELPVQALKSALSASGWVPGSVDDDQEVDMDAVVNTLLSEEFIREIVERGYVPGEEEAKHDAEADSEKSWELVPTARKKGNSGNVDHNGVGPRKGKRIKPIARPLVDIRQRQHILPSRPASASHLGAPHPWAHFASLATHLTRIVPTTSYTQFLALFHNPTFETPAKALRAHFAKSLRGRKVDDGNVQRLTELVPLESDEQGIRADVRRDAQICLAAAQGRVDDAYDLLTLLKDLDVDGAVIIHSLPASPSLVSPPPSPAWPKEGLARKVAQAPLPSPVAPTSSPPKPPPNVWKTVNRTKTRDAYAVPEGLAAFIPAYQTGNGKHASLTSDKEDEDPASCRQWADEYRMKRDSALRQASSHWKHGRLGSEVALHYAQEARKFQDLNREWAVRGARAQVKQYRRTEDGGRSIDLHGLTVHESLVVVQECVNDWWSSAGSGVPSGSFTIITGVGKHSNGPAVLAPAVQKMLQGTGWHVRKDYGKLVVTGGRRGS